MPTNIVVIGMGYVGIPMAALLANVDDFYVTGIQRRSKRSGWKIDWLNQGKNPFEGEEPGLDDLIAKVVKNRKFKVTDKYDDVDEADFILIDVQTPVDLNSKIPRYESLKEVAERISSHLKKGVTIIVESTVAPGTTDNIIKPILEERSNLKRGQDFYLVFSFERVMPGKLLEYITDFPRVIGGGCVEANERAKFLYGKVVKKELQITDTLTAELTKCIENAYRDVNIAFANEMALLCEDFNRNIFEIIELINYRHDRMMHYPGSGVGGHCLTKDPYLLEYGHRIYTKNKYSSDIILKARNINDYMPIHMVELMEGIFRESGRLIDNIKIVLLGVSYKANTDDTRNTPTQNIIKALKNRYHSHNITYIAHDPYVKERDYSETELTDDFGKAVSGADVLLFTTNHSEYYNIDLDDLRKKIRTPIIIDGRNIFKKEIVEKKGFIYRKVGEGPEIP
ncbi:MAG: nucleotide sugar dehydrogenase [Promethearchaeota archaeon]|nr:MAG: nucleotide sugar dehydrogenase [Candidatus Lokiarchaeota archaeon]